MPDPSDAPHNIRLLLVEDSSDIAELVEASLAPADLPWTLEVCPDGSRGLERALSGDFDVVVLDVQLPGIGGFEICKQLRAKKPELPILMLTSRDSELDRVLGLELGADDYITKPFNPAELFARIRAVFRRRNRAAAAMAEPQNPDTYSSGALRIEFATRKVFIDGQFVALTQLEFDLLAFFVSNPGAVITRAQLLEHVWQIPDGSDVSVNTMVNRVRRKLCEADIERYLRGVRGVGYQYLPKHD